MGQLLGGYVLFEVFIVVVAVLATWWVRQRRKRSRNLHPPQGFQRTDEVFTDPTTGNIERVWYNPQTGERFYQSVGREEE